MENTAPTPPANTPKKSGKKGCLIGCAVAAVIAMVLAAIVGAFLFFAAKRVSTTFTDELLREGEKFVTEVTNVIERAEAELRARQQSEQSE